MKRYTVEEAKRVWITSDQHFDHTNIIKYCRRPFASVQTMNGAMLKNWNHMVAPNDLIYFLGDMAYGRHSKPASHWLNQLNGRKIFIKGSHDRRREIVGDSVLKVADRAVIWVEGISFLLVHNPFSCIVNGWDGWIIHGHTHNKLPFLSDKRINVCVEVTGYKPIRLYKILQEVKKGRT